LVSVAPVWLTARAEQQAATPRIGVLDPSGSATWAEGFREGLRRAGYREGNNLVVEWRRPAETEKELQSAASDLMRSRVGLVVTLGTPATRAALQGASLPVVFLVGDPVAAGFAASLAKPGGNATGVSVISPDLVVKRLELLHQLAPKARRIGHLSSLSNPAVPRVLPRLRAAARTLGVELETIDASDSRGLDVVLHTLPNRPLDALLVAPIAFYLARGADITEAVHRSRIPAVYPYREFLTDGGLASYGPDLKAIGSLMAGCVDKILKGANPAELPIEEVSTYQLIINLRAAHEFGINVPQEILFRADEVIR
jgi:putative ABC transport system substrate-binding protein